MKKVTNIILILIGFILKIISRNFEVKNHSIIGSASGHGYSDNGKHLFHYYFSTNHNVYFITKSYKLFLELKQVYGNKILYNYSLKGVCKILYAKHYFFTHNIGDVDFVHNKNTKVICLFHGMPIKCIVHDYKGKGLRKNRIMTSLVQNFVIGFNYSNIHLIVSTSKFFNEFLASAFLNNNIRVMSYPKINYLNDKINESNLEPKNILYMPTHRDYGFGNLNPLIFYTDIDFRNAIKDLGFFLKYRFHPNMKKALSESLKYNDLKDYLDNDKDSQDSLLSASILISDYSSCIFDFLLLERPIVFYLYDNYEESDNNIYYRIESLGIGPIARSEAELKSIIIKIINDDSYRMLLVQNIKEKRRAYLTPKMNWEDYSSLINEHSL